MKSRSRECTRSVLFWWDCVKTCDPYDLLTHWGRVTLLYVSKLTIIGSDNGLSPDRRQAIIWTNPGLLLIEPLGTNFSETLMEIRTFSFKKMRMKVSSKIIRISPREFVTNQSYDAYCTSYHVQIRTSSIIKMMILIMIAPTVFEDCTIIW